VDADRFPFQVFGPADFLACDHHVGEFNQRRSNELGVDAGGQTGQAAVGRTVIELHLIVCQRGEGRRLAADIDVLALEAVLLENSVFQSGV
jgi:hypothetical protein